MEEIMRCKNCGDKMQNVVYNVTVASKDKGKETVLRTEMNEYYVCKCGEVINEQKSVVE
jgi:CDGSH-type Zn-finger protein